MSSISKVFARPWSPLDGRWWRHWWLVACRLWHWCLKRRWLLGPTSTHMATFRGFILVGKASHKVWSSRSLRTSPIHVQAYRLWRRTSKWLASMISKGERLINATRNVACPWQKEQWFANIFPYASEYGTGFPLGKERLKVDGSIGTWLSKIPAIIQLYIYFQQGLFLCCIYAVKFWLLIQ
jgi:hypothetical protein